MANDTNTYTLISPYSKIKVHWSDQTHNYSKEAKNKIRNYFANKYGVNKNNITVVYKPIKINDKGDRIEITGANIENIMDINYQRSLMKEMLDREKKNVDINRLMALDDKVNSELNIDLTQTIHRSWSIRWIMIDNFLSFGENNFIPFGKMKGLTIVNSIPPNQGGKTTMTIDAIKYLLHGTTTKTDKNEQIFNTYTDKNELTVRGMIDIDGEEIIIERKLKRSAKTAGGWNVTNKVNYYKLLPDGEEGLQNEEDAKETGKKIKESIGSEKDFEMLVLATEKNLEDLIGLTTTESGKILTRLIGLEVLELKEGVARGMYNEFSKKKKSNEFDVITLSTEIEEHNTSLTQNRELEISLKTKLADTKTEIVTLTNEKEAFLNSKEKIDVEITTLNPSSLEKDIDDLTNSGIKLRDIVKVLKEDLTKIGVLEFDEDLHFSLTKTLNTTTTDIAVNDAEITRLKKVVLGLVNGGVCQSCNRKLDNVDNSEHIAKHEAEITTLETENKTKNATLSSLNSQITGLNDIKKLVDNKNKIELDISRNEVEMGLLRNKIASKKNDLDKYRLNLEAIEFNKNIDSQVSNVKTKIQVAEYTKDQTTANINRIENDIKMLIGNIDTKNKLIETIKKEEEVEKIFKIYIELVGKKGISKLVLRSVLPIINSELQRLLEDVVDFEIEIFMDDKNDVQFLLVKDGITKLLKSGSGLEKTAASLALRCVLGRVSTLPMPNFITFDEILGKVAPENLEKLKMLFDKIKDMYDIVFFITHNDVIKDWSTTIVTVVKDNNVSSVSIK